MKPSERFANRDFPWLFVVSLLFFVLVAAAVRREYSADWRKIQTRYRNLEAATKGPDAVRNFRVEIRQLWIPRLNRVDRCVTCHLNYELVSSAPSELPEPFKPHPALAYLGAHGFPNFGCTTCHGGQGFATRTRDAHGQVAHWDDPLITTKLAARYGLTRGELMEMKCNSCHRRDAETSGMDLINLAKRLVREKGCTGCHVIDGKGGHVGPELTYEGDKNPELFDFSHVEGEETVLNWQVQHFKNPQKVSPGSVMPALGFSDREAKALSLLVMSWKKEGFPPEYIPQSAPKPAGVSHAPGQASGPSPVSQVSEAAKRGRRLFQSKGCQTCHSLGAERKIGPGLLGISKKHNGEWLRAWLSGPAAFLGSHPKLKNWPAEFGGMVMPNPNLSARETSDMVNFLETL